ncbi:MAG: hypothetical protein MI741_01990 [Rhodospirillales bacterium]|nr:hypothetical protein [Rhodospirillales bacterium]
MLATRIRDHLRRIAGRETPITYRALADAMNVRPPHRIRRVAEALEQLMREDAENNRPFIASLVISKARGGLPAPGFFECAGRLGRFDSNPSGPDAAAFLASERAAAEAFWRTGKPGDEKAEVE